MQTIRKNFLFIMVFLVCLGIVSYFALAKNGKCNKADPGYDQYGYNFRSEIFRGNPWDAHRGLLVDFPDITTLPNFKNFEFLIRWDHYISEDCDGDGIPDTPVIELGSKVKITNVLTLDFANNAKIDITVKAVAPPPDATLEPGTWTWTDNKSLEVIAQEIPGYELLVQLPAITNIKGDPGIDLGPILDKLPIIPLAPLPGEGTTATNSLSNPAVEEPTAPPVE